MSIIAQRAHSALVVTEFVAIVLPAVAVHTMTTVTLIAATTMLWIAYFVGWWALLSLLRIFSSFVHETVKVGPMSIIGLVAGSVTVVTLLWSSFTGSAACLSCKPPELLVYRPELFCVAVAMHWSFLCWKGFRICTYKD